MKFLECYNKWMKTGRMPKDGLCNSLPDQLIESEAWKMCKRTKYDTIVECEVYWAYEFDTNDPQYNYDKYNYDDRYYAFTPLRQTLILLAAAINGELD